MGKWCGGGAMPREQAELKFGGRDKSRPHTKVEITTADQNRGQRWETRKL